MLHTFKFFDASLHGGDRFLVFLLLLSVEFFRVFQLLHSSLQVILGFFEFLFGHCLFWPLLSSFIVCPTPVNTIKYECKK